MPSAKLLAVLGTAFTIVAFLPMPCQIQHHVCMEKGEEGSGFPVASLQEARRAAPLCAENDEAVSIRRMGDCFGTLLTASNGTGMGMSLRAKRSNLPPWD